MLHRFAAASLALSLVGCSDDGLVCGEGTVRQGDACVAAEGGAHAGGRGPSGGAGGGATGGAGGAGGSGPVDPGYPVFPDTIGTLTVAIRTGSNLQDGTDTNELSICLSETDCFRMDVLDVDDFRTGEFDVFHFEDVGLPRSAVDRVEIRSVGGMDAWRPGCMEIRFDGEPVYCDDSLGALLGNGNANGEAPVWTDARGLHESCVTCYPEPLTHGPMVGAVDHQTARLLFRTDATRKVTVRLLESGSEESPVVAYAYPSPTNDFMHEIAIDGLAPSKRYVATFDVEGSLASKTATFATAAAPGTPTKTRIAFGSCAKGFVQPIFATIADEAPDHFFFIGDNHYANSADLGSLRWYYRTSLEIPERGDLSTYTPALATWDDHDYVGNDTIGTSPGKEVALRVFDEYWANPALGTPEVPGVFFNHRIGDIEVFFLDDRYYRSPDNDPNGTMLGAEQTTWLMGSLAASTATFKLLVSGSIWSFTGDETWTDFPVAREALLDFIRDQEIGGVVLLGGDVHRSMLRRIQRTQDGAYDLPELVSSPLANAGSTCPSPVPDGVSQVGCYEDEDYFISADIDTTVADPTLVARVINQDGVVQGSMTVLRSELGP